MELPDSVMRDLHLDVHLGLNETFSFSPQTLTSASTISSCTSPDYAPFTPTSERSTPLRSNSMDFSASFDSYNSFSSYDFTPPSSAVSTTFSMNSSFTNDGSELTCMPSDLPATPTRTRANPEFSGLNLSGLNLSGCGSHAQTTPSHGMPVYSFPNDDLFNQTYTSNSGYANNWDTASMWVHPESPVDFIAIPTPPKASLRSLDEVKRTSVALQNEQRKGLRKAPVSRAKAKKTLIKKYHGQSPVGFQVIPKNRYKCQVEGCNLDYQRKEHMKRHMDTIHEELKQRCEWCGHSSNRGDNFKTHLEKHLQPGSKTPRVSVITDPVEREKIKKSLAEISTRQRKATKTKTRS